MDHIRLEQGLSDLNVLAVVQDNLGFMWFGTSDGLNRFDGYRMRVFKHDPEDPTSLASSFVTALAVDGEGTLWVGGSIGLSRFQPASGGFVSFRSDPGDPFSLPDNQVRNIHPRTDGRLWLVAGRYAVRFDPDAGRSEFLDLDRILPGSHSGYVNSHPGDDDSLWVLTETSLLHLGPKLDPIQTIELEKIFNSEKKPFWATKGLTFDRQGTLWIGTNRGLYGYHPVTGRTQYVGARFFFRQNPEETTQISCLMEDDRGHLWISGGEGLFSLGPDRKELVHILPKGERSHPGLEKTTCLVRDRGQVVWAGTSENGLFKFYRGGGDFPAYGRPLLPSPMVCAFLEDGEGWLWLGTKFGVTILEEAGEGYRKPAGSVPETEPLEGKKIWSLLKDRHANVWAGTEIGLAKWSSGSRSFSLIQHDPENPRSLAFNQVRSLHQDRSGNLWVGTNGKGLSRLDSRTGDWSHMSHDPFDETSLAANYVNCFFEDETTLWIGASGGLNKWLPDRDGFERWTTGQGRPQPLPNGFVVALHGQKPYGLWIGTHGGGLLLLSPDGSIRTYLKKDGLPDLVIQGIAEDGRGHLWLGTHHGLSRFDPNSETFQNYTVDDGLQGMKFQTGAVFRGEGGRLFFGGPMGFNAFYPDRIFADPTPPPVVLTDLFIFQPPRQVAAQRIAAQQVAAQRVAAQQVAAQRPGFEPGKKDGDTVLVKTIDQMEALRLQPHQSVFSIGFAALSYRNPAKNRYAYRLDGFDKDWIFTGADRRLATYSNLDPGEYRFRIKAANGAGVWNEVGTSLSIYVASSPWRSPMSLAILFGGVLGLAGFYTLRFRRKRQRPKRGIADSKGTGPLPNRISLFASPGKGPALHVASGMNSSKNGTAFDASNTVEEKPSGSDPGFGGHHIQEPEVIPAPSSPRPKVMVLEEVAPLDTPILTCLAIDHDLVTGFSVSSCTAWVWAHLPDLVICDVGASEVNGFELCRILKREEKTSLIPIILIAENGFDQAKIIGLEMGADDFLIKPFPPAELCARVANLIQSRQRMSQQFKRMLLLNDHAKEEGLSADEEFLRRTIAAIRDHLADHRFGVYGLADELAISRRQLHRKITGITGMTPVELIKTIRLQKAASLLRKKTGNIAQIGYAVGFSNPAYFTKQFRGMFGRPPRQFATGEPTVDG